MNPVNDWLRDVAAHYHANLGPMLGLGAFDRERPADYLELPEADAYAIADVFEAAPMVSEEWGVRLAYSALAAETFEQFDLLKRLGFTFQPWSGEGQPYRDSASMSNDVARMHLWYFPTLAGFGENETRGHPLQETPAGADRCANDLFRCVHDVFGHAMHGYGFGARGEHNAWATHSAMFSPLAARAMGWETRGQNSWVNYGPHLRDRKKGRVHGPGHAAHVPPSERPYAPQKVGLLPTRYTLGG